MEEEERVLLRTGRLSGASSLRDPGVCSVMAKGVQVGLMVTVERRLGFLGRENERDIFHNIPWT